MYGLYLPLDQLTVLKLRRIGLITIFPLLRILCEYRARALHLMPAGRVSTQFLSIALVFGGHHLNAVSFEKIRDLIKVIVL